GVALTPDGKTLVSGSLGQFVFGFDLNKTGPRPAQCKCWDLATGQERWSVEAPGGVGAVATSPNGQLVATTSIANGDVRLLEITTGATRTIFRGHKAPVNQLWFIDDGETLITADAEGAVKCWAVKSAPEPLCLQGNLTAKWLCMTPDSNAMLYPQVY